MGEDEDQARVGRGVMMRRAWSAVRLAWAADPLGLTTAVLVTMMGVPVIFFAMFGVVSWGLNSWNLTGILATCMAIGAAGLMGVYIAELWRRVSERVARVLRETVNGGA